MLFFLPLLGFAAIDSPGDVQFWQRVEVNSKLSEKTFLHFVEESRYGDDVSKFYYGYLQLQLGYQPRSWISFRPGYRQICRRSPLNSSKFRPEYNPITDLILTAKNSLWDASCRNRFQFLVLENDERWLYRILLRAQRKIESLDISMYLENEFFLRNFNDYNEDRIVFGLMKNLPAPFSLDVFYMARFLRRDGWIYTTVFGFNLNVSI